MLLNRLIVFFKYAIFWLSFFFVSRLLFLIYNFHFASDIPFGHLMLSFIKGFKHDLSVTGYILFFAGLIMVGTCMAGKKTITKIFNVYTLVFIVLLSIVTIVDMELYRNWGFRMDSTVLLYLKTPKEAMASTKLWLIIVLFLATFLLAFTAFKLYKRFLLSSFNSLRSKNWLAIPVFLVISASMIIPIRGGFGIAPINTGAVFYSKYFFANHAAVNVHWHIGNSLVYLNKEETKQFMSDAEVEHEFNNLYKYTEANDSLVNIEKPNIVILILESFTSRIIEPLGGMKGVTPCLNRLAGEGVLFSHCFANGDRSDKGIVSILSGYPAQPTTSIIKKTNKAVKLPSLSKELSKLGYNTSFYYGGDIGFANMKSYLYNSQFDKFVTLSDFDSKDKNSKWGIHDHVVFERFLKDCNEESQPFFKTFFTLSSHEPFDVPLQSNLFGKGEEAAYLNSIYYTDSCIGAFVEDAKNQTWWNNTLIILVADHGSRLPGNVAHSSREKFEIPLLLLGGALAKTDTVIDTYFSQMDIPKLIGRQLNQPFEEFTFSKNEISKNQSFAFYVFNNGFGYFNDSTGFIYDNTSDKIIAKEEGINKQTIKQGKAFMQKIYNDYNNK